METPDWTGRRLELTTNIRGAYARTRLKDDAIRSRSGGSMHHDWARP